MTRFRAGRINGRPSLGHRVITEAWLTLVSPAWPRGHLRLLGAAGVVEGVFLLLIATLVPITTLAVACLVAGVVVFTLSFVRFRSRAARR